MTHECKHCSENHKAEADDLQAVFDLRWVADMRAIARWKTANPGRENTWPDHTDLVVWLMEKVEELQEKLDETNEMMDNILGDKENE